MLSWTILRVSCALAAHVIANAHAADMKEIFQLVMHQHQLKEGHAIEHRHQDKLPTQPIHRSILSHRKRTILREKHASGGSAEVKVADRNVDSSLRVTKDRRTSEGESSNEDDEDDEQSYSHDEQSSPSESIPPLLKSPWWVKIHEEFGQNSFNYIPGSRRAASSVVFTYDYNNDRLLVDQEKEGVKADAIEGNNTTEPLDQLVQNETDTSSMLYNEAIANSTTATEETDIESESNGADSATESLGQGIESESDTNSTNPVNWTDVEGNAVDSDESVHTSESAEQETPESTTTPGEEYMIVSGGYTDHDWKTFPVYAFPITSTVRTLSGEWIDLSPSELAEDAESQCDREDGGAARENLYLEAKFLDDDDNTDGTEDPWEHAAPCAPSGRMGHQSVIHDDKLYVFGGLIYDGEQSPGGYGKKETFRLEDVPFVYRLDLAEMFEARKAETKQGGDRSLLKVKGWQRIIPRVKPFSTPGGMSSTSAAEVLLTSVNRGEMQGGLWSSESTGGNDKFVMYGGLRIAKLEYEGYGHNGPSKFVKGETTFGSSQMRSHKIVELPLGDVWAYDLVLDCWEKITNNYGRGIDIPPKTGVTVNKKAPDGKDDDWWQDLSVDYSLYPRPRTAHAATVVGNELIIHGGMGWDEHTNDWDGSTDWEALDDMWILNLSTREWTRRWLFPLLVRSYHSLVGWNVDGSKTGWDKEFENVTSWEGPIVAAFGGYTTGIDVFSGEEIAYVFDDLLISYPPPPKTNYDDPPSPWLKASMNTFREDGDSSISTRYEHSAVLSKQGILSVWGGSFSGTSDVKGIWMINIAGEHSTVNLSMAEADSIYDDYERTISALHKIVIMLMFMSISLTLLLGLTQRYQELVQQANDDAAMAAGMAFSAQDLGGIESPPTNHRGNGLHPEIIDTLPRKIYSASENRDGAQEDEQECCPICLLDYSEGDELRVLPCNHFMHKSCLDAWLVNNPSCPTCRYSLSELVDDRPMMQLRTLRSRLSTSPALARFLGHDYAESIDGIEMSSRSRAVIDLRYVSSLALSEEDTVTEARGEDAQQGDTDEAPDPQSATAMGELSSWRRRRRRLQRDRRRPRFPSMRNPRLTRVPLADLDEA